VVVLGFVSAGLAFYYFNYSPDRTIHPLRGIDMSHHHGWSTGARLRNRM
jgi:hypothetical protein